MAIESANSCFVLAAEMSGEEHLLSFLPELMQKNKQCHFYGVGGNRIQELGVELLFHLKDFSSWGLVEVIHKLPFYYKSLNFIQQEIERRNTKTAILVDFQEANYYLAKKLTRLGVKVLYYVAPQAWGWRAYRAKGLASRTHKLYTILPFEKQWFSSRGVKQVVSVAHPLSKISIIPSAKNSQTTNILILPGSRNAECYFHLGIFLNCCKMLKDNMPRIRFTFSLVKGPSIREGIFQHYANHPIYRHLTIYPSIDLNLALSKADFCLAASGTVSLQTSLYKIPTLVCYKAHLLTAFIFYEFIKYKSYITLTNLILQEEVLPEFLQDEVSEWNLFSHLKYWINNPDIVNKIKDKLSQLLPLLKGDFPTPIESMDEVLKTHY